MLYNIRLRKQLNKLFLTSHYPLNIQNDFGVFVLVLTDKESVNQLVDVLKIQLK